MARRERYLVGLDVGTSRVTAVVGEGMDDGTLDIVGIGTAESRGIKRGVVVNVDAAVDSIKKTIEEAELMAGVEIDSVHLALSGPHIKGFNSRGVIAVAGKNREITRDDVRRCLGTKSVRLRRTVTIRAPIDMLYAFWRDLSNLPRFLRHVRSVEPKEGTAQSHWVALGPFGAVYQWDAEILNDEPNERIAWQSLESSEVDHAGTVEFRLAPGGKGTEVRVVLRYHPRSGYSGVAIAKLFGQDPAQELDEDLRTLKQILETGEVATLQGQPSGRRA